MSKEEKLIEEITNEIGRLLRGTIWPREGPTAKKCAINIIALMLSAVRDGLEIPGEVGRGSGSPGRNGFLNNAWLDLDEDWEPYMQVELIALREEGIRKEEEK